jgi:thiosulfate dehydrogenase [quinone] large subunit
MLARALLPLRAFLGFTFCFAGLQKLANPGFFEASNPASIQAQLAGAVRLSPIHALISPMTHLATPLGLLIAFAELAVGLGTLLGLWQRVAAAGGVVLSLMLFLAVSFHSSPYYTGADIVFAFAWTPLLLAGAGPVLSADAMITARAQARARAGRGGRKVIEAEASRREVVLKWTVTGVAAAAGLVLGGVVAGVGRLAGGTKSNPGGALPSPTESASAATATPSASSGSAGSHPAGTAIALAKNVPVGGSASFTDPSSGDPSIVIQATAGKFLAFDAVCPHAGCAVAYDQSARVIACPCHGSQFNAATGAVEQGPATTGLKPIAISQDSNGQLYVT